MSQFVDHLLELMQPWGKVSARRMFGGHGLYRDGVMFALVAYDTLYLKADGDTKARFIEAKSEPFVYDGKGKPIEMSYWRAPADCLEDASVMTEWCRLAYATALRAKGPLSPDPSPARGEGKKRPVRARRSR